MKKAYLILLVLAVVLTGCSLKKRIAKADNRFANGEYYLASTKYKQINRHIKGKKNRFLKARINYNMGVCYYKLSQYPKAAKAFQVAVRYKYQDSVPEAYLYLAKSQMASEKYKDAATNFKYYLAINPMSSEAREGLMSTEQIPVMKKGYTRFRIEEFKHFNSRRNSDLCPMFASREDDNTVYFTSNRGNSNNKKKVKTNDITGVADNDIYSCHRNKSGKWEGVTPIEGDLNSSDDEGVTCFSADGKTMLFTRCSVDRPAGQIFQSQRSGAEWTDASEVKLFDDSTITVGHPTLSPSGDLLFFVSDNKGGEGGNDIWMVEKVNTEWGIPAPLGTPVNTSGDEMFPYCLNDTTLYFSSNGHVGLGGLDMYVATRDTAGVWTVRNLLAPMNSAGDDFGITFNATGDEGFFSSNRQQRKPIDKIYHFFYPPLEYAIEGLVKDEKGDPVGDAVIRLVGDNGDIVKTKARRDGTYHIKLTVANVRYVMMASQRGYLNSSHKFSTQNIQGSKTFTNDFVLVSQTKSVKMDNIFYEFGKWTLTKESEAGLQGLVKILTDNPNITIELSAHTDMVGTDKANDELSQKRAQAVVDYLIKAGIAADRLTAVGYGKKKPVTVTAEHAKQYKWLKEGDVLTPEFIQALPADKQEICNTLNRRTEFKVLKTNYNLY